MRREVHLDAFASEYFLVFVAKSEYIYTWLRREMAIRWRYVFIAETLTEILAETLRLVDRPTCVRSDDERLQAV